MNEWPVPTGHRVQRPVQRACKRRVTLNVERVQRLSIGFARARVTHVREEVIEIAHTLIRRCHDLSDVRRRQTARANYGPRLCLQEMHEPRG